MEVAKVTSKGQITIPISIRRQLGINEGDKVLFIYKPDGVLMVNPVKYQGGGTGDIVDVAETEMAAEAIAAAKKRAKPKAPPPVAAIETDEEETYIEETAVTEAPPPVAAAPRPVPPPVEELEKPADKHVGGFNLSTLLDDIRSIGSNI